MIVLVQLDFPNGVLRYATANYQDNLGNWKSEINAISPLTRGISDKKTFEVSQISITFNDTERFFRNMMNGQYRNIAGKKVTLMTTSYEPIYTGAVVAIGYDRDVFSLTIQDQLGQLNLSVLKNISKTTFPNCIDAAVGQPIPKIYGSLSSPTGAVQCWKVDNNLFLLAAHHCTSVSQVFLPDYSTPTFSLINNTDGYAYIQCTSTTDYITANCTGKNITDPITALSDILSNLQVTYDNTSFQYVKQIMQDRMYQIACIIEESILKEVLEKFCTSFGCDFFVNRFGQIALSIFIPESGVPAFSFTDKTLYSFSITENLYSIQNRFKYMYGWDSAVKNFRHQPIYENPASITYYGERYALNEPLDLRYVQDTLTAYDVAQRKGFIEKNPKRTAIFSIPLDSLLLDLCQIGDVTTQNAIDENKRIYQAFRLTYNFLNQTIEIEATDMTIFQASSVILGDERVLPPTWLEANEIQRKYAYLADENTGQFSDGSPAKILF